MKAIKNAMERVRAFLGRLSALFGRTVEWVKAQYRRRPDSYLIFCFLLPFFLMSLIYILIGTWPFGKSSVLVLDLNGQYVYFFEALRDFVWGDASLLYSFSRSLGGEFLGIYAYYLASPLSYIVALFPADNITEALLLMFVLKQGLCGLTFGYFLHKTAELSPTTTVIFSTVYAMTAYGIVMQHNTMWTDNVILLPLIALGIRLLITEGKYKLYTISLALAILSNFYIGYMTCIFCVLYFFYIHLAMSKNEKWQKKQHLPFIRSGVRFGFFSLLAGAIGMLIVIPAVYALSFGKNTFTNPTYEFVCKIDLFDVFTKFFFGSYDTVRPEGLPFVYCGIITLLLIPFYFINRRISIREKAANLFLSLVLLFSFCIQVIDMMWHGGQAPNWLNYRYSYMLCFLMVGMAAKGFEDARRQSARWVLYAAMPLLLVLMLAEHFGYEHMQNIFFPVALNIICIGVYGVALSLFITKRHVAKSFASFCILLVVCVEMVTAGLINIVGLHLDVVISWRHTYTNFKERWEDAFETVQEADDSPFYRMEKLKYRMVNDPYLLDYRGVSGSTSTLNRDTIAFLNSMGYSSASHASCYTGTNPFVDSFLSISYVASELGAVFPSTYQEVYNNGDIVVYKNPDALPIAFGVSDDVHSITLRPYETDFDGNRVDPEDDRTVHTEASPFLRMNALAAALLGEDVQLFTPLTSRYSGDNIMHVSSSRYYIKRDKEQDGYVNFTVQIPENCELFAYFPSEYPEDSSPADYYLNDTFIGRHFVREQSGYLCLGEYKEGDHCKVSFKLGDNGIYIRQRVDYFYMMDRAVYDRLIATLSAGGLMLDKANDAFFNGRITVSEGYETVLTTIPYDRGWNITVDGEKIEGYETLDALLAFDLAPGEHTITMRYMPREYVIAFYIFLAGTTTLATIIALEYLLKRHKKRKAADTAEKGASICSIIFEEN